MADHQVCLTFDFDAMSGRRRVRSMRASRLRMREVRGAMNLRERGQ